MELEGGEDVRGTSTVTPGAGAEVYGELIADELAELRSVKTSLEQRAVTVITTSGVLVTLLLGLAALLSDRESFELPSFARLMLLPALAFFVAAAVLALVANRPRRYDVPTVEGLRRVLSHQWHDEPWVARRRVGVTLVNVIESYHRANEWKSYYLRLAIAAECTAVGFVALAVAFIVVQA